MQQIKKFKLENCTPPLPTNTRREQTKWKKYCSQEKQARQKQMIKSR